MGQPTNAWKLIRFISKLCTNSFLGSVPSVQGLSISAKQQQKKLLKRNQFFAVEKHICADASVGITSTINTGLYQHMHAFQVQQLSYNPTSWDTTQFKSLQLQAGKQSNDSNSAARDLFVYTRAQGAITDGAALSMNAVRNRSCLPVYEHRQASI